MQNPAFQHSKPGIRAPSGYRITGRIPVVSAFKEVFIAVRTTPIGEINVVLKRYRPASSENVKNLMDELRLQNHEQLLTRDSVTHWAGPLLHPNLIPCDITQNETGEIFLVEPLLECTLDKKFPSGTKQFAEWAEGLLRGVWYMHKKGYVHGDIKPENMGLRNGNPVLIDFGISSRADEKMSGWKNPGSIKTRPPELFGENVKPAKPSDMWSLGASFYYMVTRGEYPFVTGKELEGLPSVGTDERTKFEEGILGKVTSAVKDSTAFYDLIGRNLVSTEAGGFFREIIFGCLRIGLGERPTASHVLGRIPGGNL